MTPETIGRYRILKQLGAGEQGRLDEGIRELDTAHELDPLSGFIFSLVRLRSFWSLCWSA